ncbi:MAG: hypothetical protein A2V58_07170 [Candidatus Muproteobacteria bacterium RBG_19FT_COMBO_61_10]|jgi:uncharacterized MAPEG superfamily protein|uniref:MAPEG family protein n=1 Tax=Candidatus Muproteobacteria bacterium RBG_19FT_COMBO_61_10 TaxID=1817761 RepID=A0A1F6UEC9_9PROT|nr:MAG: hypothetical protein A2V58_07170 [Candidatus Muproteobacteria bacterium RBG_19FT_COMBO_61_10]
MTTAYWCVLIAALLPYVWVLAAKIAPDFDNAAPRAYLAKLTGWRQRAVWAQLNAFEALPAFAAAVIIAQQLGASQGRIDLLALAFIGFRLAHGLAYIGDWATLRSLLWTGGMGCVIGLFVSAA